MKQPNGSKLSITFFHWFAPGK